MKKMLISMKWPLFVKRPSLWGMALLLMLFPLVFGACQNKKAPVSSGGGTAPVTVKGLKTIYFDFDDSTIRTDQTSSLQGNAEYLKANSGTHVTIEGNCDERGTNEYNMALGDRRARGTKNYIINLGLDPSRMNTISYGEERPVGTCHDESCWWQNRRSDFVK